MNTEKKKRFLISKYNDIIEDWSEYEELRPADFVRAMCHQCCCYQHSEVVLCQSKCCPLWLPRIRYYKLNKRKTKKGQD